MKKIKVILTVFAVGLLGTSFAQISLEDELRKEFNSFKKDTRKSFDDFVKANDDAFGNHLRMAWEELESNGIEKKKPDPKPVAPPTITPSVDPVIATAIAVVAPDPSDKKEKKKDEEIKCKSEPANFAQGMVGIPFFGAIANATYDKDFITSVSSSISNQVIADYWDKMANTNHYGFIKQLQEKKETMKLNDWGYFELVSHAANDICKDDENAAKLLSWFILVKSHYKAKVGYSPKGVHLLLPFSNKVYGKPYFTIQGQRFYVMEKVGKLSTYKADYKVATKKIELNVEEPMHIGTEVKTRDLNFEHKGKKYSFVVKYIKNDINFYENYPQADVKVYFDAAVSEIASKSLLTQLKPIVATMGEVEASDFLLALVQKSFAYKTDPEQFGREKFFFAEEIFHYPYSDCEDRSVLYAFLVKELLDLEVVGLKYPGHMATAVAFSEEVNAHHMFYAGKKFTVCDPTYINATSGMCMPQFINTNAFIVPMKK